MKLKEIKPGMVIHCKTEIEAWYLLEHLSKLGFVWLSGRNLLDDTNYRTHGNETCYEFVRDSEKRVAFGTYEFYENNRRDIVEFSSLIIKEKTYEDGLNEAWEFVRKVSDISYKELSNIFGVSMENPWGELIDKHSASEAISKLEAYEAEKQIRVGNVVVNTNNSNVKLLVTAIYGDHFDGIKVGQSDAHGKLGSCYSGSSFGMYKRTGINIDISSILAEIGKE